MTINATNRARVQVSDARRAIEQPKRSRWWVGKAQPARNLNPNTWTSVCPIIHRIIRPNCFVFAHFTLLRYMYIYLAMLAVGFLTFQTIYEKNDIRVQSKNAPFPSLSQFVSTFWSHYHYSWPSAVPSIFLLAKYRAWACWRAES